MRIITRMITSAVLCLGLLHTALSLTVNNGYEAFLWTYGSNTSISISELSAFVTQLTSNDSSFIRDSRARLIALNGSCPSCEFSCQSVDEIISSRKLASSGKLSADDLKAALPALFDRIQNPFCYRAAPKEKKTPKEVWNAAAWGYGFLMVTIINGCALLGFSFSPFIGRRYYKLIMTFMVALAVGSLCGSAVLFLFPDALRLSELEALLPNHGTYIWKSTVVMGGVYMFFLLERILKLMIEWKGQRELNEASSCSMNIRRVPDIDPALKELPQHHDEPLDAAGDEDPQAVTAGRKRTSSRQRTTTTPLLNPGKEKDGDEALEVAVIQPESSSADLVNGDVGGGKVSFTKIAPVAWMIIVGDGVHNFVDGLSIGAAFSQNIVTGFSLSMAVLCEELPHELGDFAILLNSGMTVKQAMVANFGSACMCYFGLIIGIVVGELTAAAVWIFSLATGMFLYISLVDMMPEVNHMMECEDGKKLGRKKIFLLQNLGLFTGYGMLLCLALYGEYIKFQ